MNRNTLTAVAAGLLLVGCNSTKSLKKDDSAVNNPIVSNIDLTNVKEDKVPVVINPGRFTTDKVTYRLPRVVQGTYSVSNFGKYIDDFKALDYSGEALPVTKVDENTWKITNATALDKVTYAVNDTFDQEKVGGIGEEVPFSPSGTNIEDTNYVLNLHGFIGYFDTLKKNQYKLDVVAPSKFKRTSALQEIGVKTSEDGSVVTTSFLAPRYFDITDNPMFYGELDVEEFNVGDIKIVLSVYSPTKKHSAKKIKAVMEKMMQAQKSYLGSINSTPRYDIYLYLAGQNDDAPKGFGALEHHTSTVVVLPEFMDDARLAESMIDVVSHEFFHIVTPLSVHSEDVHYFDYDQPTFSKHLWMYEGVTEYFATHFQVNKGLVKDDEFFTKIMGKINSASRMNDAMSFTKMSENILEKEYHDQYINVYQKGALIGMCIDILMREESNGERGILSLMKELSNKYGKHQPFEDDALIEEITKMTYPSVGEFLNTHVVGGTPIDYNKFFEKVGVGISENKIKTGYVRNGGGFILRGDQATGKIVFTEGVNANSFWKENGAQPGDAIISINGTKLTRDNARQIIGGMFAWQPGNDIDVVLERGGKEFSVKTKLTQSYTTGKSLAPKSDASQKQKDLLQAWLKG